MANWKYNLYIADIGDEFDKDDDQTIDVKRVITTIHDRLLLLKKEVEERDEDPDYILSGMNGLDNLIDEFQYFDFDNEDLDEHLDCANGLLTDLYDFADDNRVWINKSDMRMKGIGKP